MTFFSRTIGEFSRQSRRLLADDVKMAKRRGFTLPEVIVSFVVLAMVITSAVGVLTLVMRTNSDNIGSIVANGLAQEGVEAIRFIRDSDILLGLDFDGGKGDKPINTWGAKLYDNGLSSEKYFVLDRNEEMNPQGCNKTTIANCMPIQLREVTLPAVSSSNLSLPEQISADATFAVKDFENYYRVVRVEPISSTTGNDTDKLRISSVVAWTDSMQHVRNVTLTTELTNWRK